MKASQEGAQSSNYDEEDGSSILFLSYAHSTQKLNETQLLDKGCSNHMNNKEDLFCVIDNSYKSKITLGHDKIIQFKGMGAMEVSVREGKKKRLMMYITFEN